MSDRPQKPKPAAQVLQALFENSKSPLGDSFQRYRLEQQWSEIVGPSLGPITRPVDYQNGLLTIACKNASLLTELQFFRQSIIQNVNTHIGRLWVRKLRFVSE